MNVIKKKRKWPLVLLAIVLIPVILIGGLFIWASLKPAISKYYYEKVDTGGEIEARYTAMGEHEVKFVKFDAFQNYKAYEIWYPADLDNNNQQYPLVIMANGTGVPASKTKAIFKHLASWGFIVVGNEDEFSWNGFSSYMSLNYMLKLNKNIDSIFYQKVDTENIGIAGHSQGGVGVVNAVTNYDNGSMYKAIFAASPTCNQLAAGLEWDFDLSKINIPYFSVAGTGKLDAETISPLDQMKEDFKTIPNIMPKIIARRTGIDHGQTISHADGYMTAWFMYWLQGDTKAGNAFFGDHAEILANPNWQDIERSYDSSK